MKKQFYSSVSAVIFNNEKKILLVSEDGISNWQVVTGWLEDEDVISGIKREIFEELGKVSIKVYDVIDVHSFKYKDKDLLSIWYLVKLIDGEIRTSDDIKDYVYKWASRDDIMSLDISCPKQPEVIDKAFFMIEAYERNHSLSFLKFNLKG